MGLVDLGGWLDDDALDVPNVPSRAFPDGRTYRIPSPDHRTGLRLTALMQAGAQASIDLPVLSDEDRAALDPQALADRERAEKAQADAIRKAQLSDDDERELVEQVLGSALAEMSDDGVSWVRIQRINRYALLYFTMGPEMAAESVRRGMAQDPQVPVNREARRSAQKSSRASGASATSTRTPASTSGTSRSRPVKASAGTRSSRTGS